jgi:hypothetical protein
MIPSVGKQKLYTSAALTPVPHPLRRRFGVGEDAERMENGEERRRKRFAFFSPFLHRGRGRVERKGENGEPLLPKGECHLGDVKGIQY